VEVQEKRMVRTGKGETIRKNFSNVKRSRRGESKMRKEGVEEKDRGTQ